MAGSRGLTQLHSRIRAFGIRIAIGERQRENKLGHKKKPREKIYKKAALYGICTALAMALSFIEAQIPVSIVIPGVRLGLTNLVVLFALYRMGAADAMVINFVRILLTGFTFANTFSMLYSLAGGMFSSLVMILLKHTKKFSVAGVSVAGGVAHNMGQMLVAMAVLSNTRLAYYFPALMISGVAAGAVIGILGAEVIKRLPDDNGWIRGD